MGEDFAQNSTRVLQLLIVGRFINGLAQIPFAFIQSVGRPDLTAKLHFFELPFYLFIVWWLIGMYGIIGAAIAWAGRAIVDTTLLFCIAYRLLPSGKFNVYSTIFTITIAILVLSIPVLMASIIIKAVFLFITVIIFALLTWHCFLDIEDKRGFPFL